jgi:hypothetical protein
MDWSDAGPNEGRQIPLFCLYDYRESDSRRWKLIRGPAMGNEFESKAHPKKWYLV